MKRLNLKPGVVSSWLQWQVHLCARKLPHTTGHPVVTSHSVAASYQHSSSSPSILSSFSLQVSYFILLQLHFLTLNPIPSPKTLENKKEIRKLEWPFVHYICVHPTRKKEIIILITNIHCLISSAGQMLFWTGYFLIQKDCWGNTF